MVWQNGRVANLPFSLSRLAGMLTAEGTFLAMTNADNAVVPILDLHRRLSLRLLGEVLMSALVCMT